MSQVERPGRRLPERQAARARRWVPAGCWLLAGVALLAAYWRQSLTVPVSSDGASNVLQAWDMWHGNPLLHGWTLSQVWFYSTELPQYALIEMVHGLGPGVQHLATAMTYTLIVLGAALVARGRATGREGLVRSLVAAGILLAPSLGLASATLLANPDHIGTQVLLLATWLVVDRSGGRGTRAAVLAGLLLAWAQVADVLVLYEGVLPLLVVCGLRLYQRRPPSWRHGGWRELPRPELSLAIAAAGSVLAARLALLVIQHLGGFTTSQPPTVFASVTDLVRNLLVTAEGVLVLFGADFSGVQLGAGALLPLLHLAGVALACWALVRVLRRYRASTLFSQLLAVTLVVLLLAYLLRGQPKLHGDTNEMAGVLVAGAVLAGRELAGPLIRGRHLGLAALLLIGYAAILGHNAASYDAARLPAKVTLNTRLATGLAGHHLRYGLAGYWNASSVTVASHGAIQVRPVTVHDGMVTRTGWNNTGQWYRASAHDATFMVLPVRAWKPSAEHTFGPPSATYRIAGFEVLVWDHNLLRQLRHSG